jgi:hypothetical protein
MSVTPVLDEEKVKNLLDEILKTIQTEADPHLLNQYRALIRKNVSFFKRSYLAAYLLMLRDQGQSRQRRSGGGDKARGRPNNRNSSAVNGAEPGGGAEPGRQGQRPAQQNPAPPAAPMALPDDESTQLFINIGRSRRVFPREILGLIGAKTSIPKEDIGLITILNNYSFVQVRNSVAAELQEALNGINFRGKTLVVNHARTRKEDDEDLEEPALKTPEQDEDYIESAESDAMDADVWGEGTDSDDTGNNDAGNGDDANGDDAIGDDSDLVADGDDPVDAEDNHEPHEQDVS